MNLVHKQMFHIVCMIITFETLVKNMAVIKQIRNIMAIYFCEIFETMLHIKIDDNFSVDTKKI